MKYLFKQLVLLTVIFIYGCQPKVESVNPKNWQEGQEKTFESYFIELGMKDVTEEFISFLNSYTSDSIKLEKLSLPLDFDSLFIVPGNIPAEFIENRTGLNNIPVLYSPENRSLILFKFKGKYIGYAYSNIDTLIFKVTGKQMEFSKNDSLLQIIRKKYNEDSDEFIFSGPR